MFTKTPPSHNLIKLEEAIDMLLLAMETQDKTSEEYAKMVDQLEKLYKLKEIDSPKGVSNDTLAAILGNLAGIFAILSYEHGRIITSKALGFVMKAVR